MTTQTLTLEFLAPVAVGHKVQIEYLLQGGRGDKFGFKRVGDVAETYRGTVTACEVASGMGSENLGIWTCLTIDFSDR